MQNETNRPVGCLSADRTAVLDSVSGRKRRGSDSDLFFERGEGGCDPAAAQWAGLSGGHGQQGKLRSDGGRAADAGRGQAGGRYHYPYG